MNINRVVVIFVPKSTECYRDVNLILFSCYYCYYYWVFYIITLIILKAQNLSLPSSVLVCTYLLLVSYSVCVRVCVRVCACVRVVCACIMRVWCGVVVCLRAC